MSPGATEATPDSERDRLTRIASESWYARGASGVSAAYSFEVMEPWFIGDRCLELGPAEGLVTDRLVARFSDLTVVDAAPSFCAEIQRRHPRVKVIQSLFEDLRLETPYDTVVLGHVLEHVEDPVGLLRATRQWLRDGGRLIGTVPNAMSLHRQAAVLMGLLDTPDTLNVTDHRHGHRRVYDARTLEADLHAAGLEIVDRSGYWLKPLSNAQIDAQWDDAMLAAFMQLGRQYPEIAAEIVFVAAWPTR